MKVWIRAVGRPGALLAGAIAEYEGRAARYWSLEVDEVKAERAGGGKTREEVMAREAERLRSGVAPGTELIALTREGRAWSSTDLGRHLEELALRSHPGPTFLIGGALGLDAGLAREATRRLSLSAFTLPHELARLVLAEQLYRAGTIVRGEPYHKGEA